MTPDDSAAVRQEYDRLAGEYDERWQRYVDETLRAVTDAIAFRGEAQRFRVGLIWGMMRVTGLQTLSECHPALCV